MTYNQMKVRFLDTLPLYIGYGGILSQRDGDQGDSLQRESTMLTLLTLINDPELTIHIESCRRALDKLECRSGLYTRSNNPAFWGSDPRCTSRDQLSITKLALATVQDNSSLSRVALRQTLRLGFHQNYYDVLERRYHIPDLPIPYEVSIHARGMLGPFSYMMTWLTDAFLVVDMLLRNATELNKWSADNMLAVCLLAACHGPYPSLTARLLMRAYLRSNFLDRLWHYHADPTENGCEPLYWLYCMAFAKLENYPADTSNVTTLRLENK